jgi:hypothetical protein
VVKPDYVESFINTAKLAKLRVFQVGNCKGYILLEVARQEVAIGNG